MKLFSRRKLRNAEDVSKEMVANGIVRFLDNLTNEDVLSKRNDYRNAENNANLYFRYLKGSETVHGYEYHRNEYFHFLHEMEDIRSRVAPV